MNLQGNLSMNLQGIEAFIIFNVDGNLGKIYRELIAAWKAKPLKLSMDIIEYGAPDLWCINVFFPEEVKYLFDEDDKAVLSPCEISFWLDKDYTMEEWQGVDKEETYKELKKILSAAENDINIWFIKDILHRFETHEGIVWEWDEGMDFRSIDEIIND